MDTQSDPKILQEAQNLEWLRKISLRLDELSILQRLTLLGPDRIF